VEFLKKKNAIRNGLNFITYLDELFDKFQQQTTKKLGCKKPEKS